MEEMDIL